MAFDFRKLNGRIVEKYGTQYNFAKALGLSEETRNDLFKLLQELHASRYITIYEKVKQSNQGDYNISYYEYEIVDYEEWKKARKPIRL